MNKNNDNKEILYPIRTVATMTGVNPVTLRAWESRYGLVNPRRTPKGHRLYSGQEIDVINRTLTLLEKGVAISQVAAILARESALERSTGEGPLAALRNEMLSAVAEFDEDALNKAYLAAAKAFPVVTVLDQIMVPVLETLGERWQTVKGSIAEEHFFSVYVRHKLGARFHHLGQHTTGPRLLCACLPGETHETGLLLFCLAAHDANYRLTILGADTPISEIGVAALRAQVDAVVIAGHAAGNPSQLERGLVELAAHAQKPIFVGGPVSVAQPQRIARADAVPLGTNLTVAIQRISSRLNA